MIYARVQCLKQCINAFNENKTTVVRVQTVPEDDVSKYGIVSCKAVEDKIYKVKDMIEKQEKEHAPCNIAILE